MKESQYIKMLLDQTDDLVWAVDHNLYLVYANKAYLNLMKEVTGVEKELNTDALIEGFGEGYIEKWTAYYKRALSGEFFEIEEHFYNPDANEFQYGHITFSPIRESTNEILTIACRSTDITSVMRQKDQASRLMDASLDVFCTVDDAGKFVYVSAAANEHWGYRPEELIGNPYRDLIVEEDLQKTDLVAGEIMSGRQFKSFNNRFRKKNGGIAYNLWSARWDTDSKLMYCVARDARETIEQKRLLLQSEERFKALVQDGSDLIAILDPEANYTYVSPSSTSVLGISPEVFIGQNAFDFIHPDDVERTMHFLEKVSTQKTVVVEPFRFQNRQGEWRWIETTLTNMLDNPAIKGIVANSRDITEKIEEAHRLKLFEKVINSTTDAIMITDAEPLNEPGPIIQYVNKAFTKTTGYTSGEVIGKSPRILQGPGTNYEELRALGKRLRRLESSEITVLNYTKAGEPYWVHFAVSPLADEKGRNTHWISVQRDVTEQKNNELEQALLSQISTCYREAAFHQASKEFCRIIKEFGDFDLIELWCPNLEQTQMSRIAFDSSLQDFDAENNSVSHFLKGEGLPGMVWQQEEPLHWDEGKISQFFMRKREERTVALTQIMGIPLKHDNQINGVLVIGTTKKSKGLSRFSGIISKLVTFIGSEINRKKLEEDLNRLYSTIPEILCVADFKGRFLKINPAGCELMGYKEEEILFQSFEDFAHPEDRGVSTNEIKKLEKGVTTFQFENRCITKEGKIIWLSWSCHSSNQDGLIYAAAKDISEEKKLILLNRQAHTLAKIGSWEVDFEKGKVFWSEMVHHLHETDPTSFVPELASSIEFYRSDFRPQVAEAVKNAIDNGSSFDFEAVLVTHKQNERWIRSIGRAEQVGGVTKRIFGSFQDIHASKSLELRIKEILGSISDAFYALDADWNFTYFNKEAENQLKTSAAEVLGKNIWKIFSPAKGTLLEDAYKRVASTGRSENFEYHYPGDGCWYEITVYPSNGGISSYFKNIDERRKAAEQLERAYKEKNEILESISDAFFAVDKDWTVTYWNNRAETMLGRKKNEIVGKNLWEEYPDAINSGFYRNYHKAQKIGETINFEEYYPTLDQWIEVTVYPSENGLSIYFKDITLRKMADIRLVEANERFEKVTEATNDAIWDWDVVNNTVYLGRGFKKLFGYDVDHHVATHESRTDPIHPEDLERTASSLSSVVNSGQNYWTEEYRYRRLDGSYAYVIDRGIVIRDTRGQAIRMVGAVTDISERRKHEEVLLTINETLAAQAKELERSNEELEQFAFIISHDLQEPLRMITGFMDQLKRKYEAQLDEKALRYIYFAVDGAKRMKQIILDLLLYSRANKPINDVEEVNLNEILSEYRHMRRKVLLEKRASIHSDKLPCIDTYRAPLLQIFHNLLDNALKYAKEEVHPQIEIRVKESEKEWEFAIKDNGIGIDEKFYEKIFVIFQRLHNRDRYEGTGIGLSIAKRSVEFLGGEIWVESKVDEGSTFYFTISKEQKYRDC